MSVLKKYNKEVKSGEITPVEKQVQNKTDLRKSFSKTNFDVENSQPLGGTPPTPYYQTITDDNTPLLKSFDKTSLDLENSAPVGGPNRTTAANIPGGTYPVVSDAGPVFYKQGNLAGKPDGVIVDKMLNTFTPTNTYLNYISTYKNDNN